MHPGLELVGEMKRLRRAPEPTSAMEPWLQKAVHDKLLIEKSTRVRSSDGSKVAKAVGYTCAKDSCGMLFPLGVSKQQYNRHLREAAAHRTSNLARACQLVALRLHPPTGSDRLSFVPGLRRHKSLRR